MCKIINGREIAESIMQKVKTEIEELSSAYGVIPKLVSLSSTNSQDSEIYVNMQKKNAQLAGIDFVTLNLPEKTSQDDFLSEIERLNEDPSVTGIIVQKPLPFEIDHSKVVEKIVPEKDAEGIHPLNLGRILRRDAEIVPCTPGAVMKILRSLEIDFYGKEVVVIGHSAIVGKPLSLMLLNEFATTTVCHIGTFEKNNLLAHTTRADILIVAVGKSNMVKSNWIKDGAIVIDVGINKTEKGITGDVDFEDVKGRASIITPVPGGVGPVTVSILMRNVYRCFRNQYVNL